MLLNTLGRLHRRGDPGKEKGGGKSLSVLGLARLHGSKGEQGPNHQRSQRRASKWDSPAPWPFVPPSTSASNGDRREVWEILGWSPWTGITRLYSKGTRDQPDKLILHQARAAPPRAPCRLDRAELTPADADRRDWGPARVTNPQPAGAVLRELVHKAAQVESELFPTHKKFTAHGTALQHPGQDSSTEPMLPVLRSSTCARTKDCGKTPAGAEASPYPRPVASKQLHKGTQDCRERLPR